MQNKIIIGILSAFIIIDAFLIYLCLAITPLKLKRNYFVYEYGEEIPTKPEEYVNANSSVLKSIKLDLDNVSPEVGVYQASIEYFGEVYPFEIEVTDTIRPKVQLKQIEFTVDLGKKIYAKDLIKKVEDSSRTTVYFYDENTKQFSKFRSYVETGSYIERVVVEDEHGNQSASLRVKIVVETNKVKPVITGVEDCTIKLGDQFDAMKGVKATDDLEGNITKRIKVTGNVDTHVVGEYTLTYYVQDNARNETKVMRKVKVIE